MRLYSLYISRFFLYYCRFHRKNPLKILKGIATIQIDGEIITLNAQEGIEVPPLMKHQMRNDSNQDVEFLVISQPNSRGDRINL